MWYFESFIGALYLDQGKDEVVRFISKVIFPKLELGWFDHMMDNKTELQEVLQQNGECKIKYNEVNVTGPDNERVYTMNVVVNNEVMGEGTGRTKKAAEQMAAYRFKETQKVGVCIQMKIKSLTLNGFKSFCK